MKRIVLFISMLVLCYGQDSYANYFNHAELYNEKSIEKSNSFSARGNVAITDYSGGLTYNYPLFTKKIKDGNVNISMVYNSNVSSVSLNHFDDNGKQNTYHGVFKIYGNHINSPAAFNTENGDPGTFGISNISIPSWILNVNGIAVQVFDFNKRIYTDNHANVSTHHQVNRAITGWHLQMIKEEHRDNGGLIYTYSIQILNGDGGMDVFRLNGKNYYRGEAPTPNNLKSPILIDMNRKGLIAKLFRDNLELNDPLHNNPYNRLLIQRPNGDKIVYKIDYNFYMNDKDIPIDDKTFNTGKAYYSKPFIYPLYLYTANNSRISFHYKNANNQQAIFTGLSVVDGANSGTYIVRPLYSLDQFKITASFENGSDISGLVNPYFWGSNGSQRSYRFLFDEEMDDPLESEINKSVTRHPMFSKIIDPENNETNITYENYSRDHKGLLYKYVDMDYDFSSTRSFENHIRHNLKRIKTIEEPAGKVHDFDYLDPTSLSYMHVGDLTSLGKNMSDEYKVIGREPYNSVMLERYTTKDASAGPVKDITYYKYDSNILFEHHQSGLNKWQSTDDTRFITHKYIIDNNNDTIQTTKFTYRNYNSEPYGVDREFRMYTNPSSNELKLLEKIVYTGNAGEGDILSSENYVYDVGNQVNSKNGDKIYDGMFDLKRTNTTMHKETVAIDTWKANHQTYHKVTDPVDTDIVYTHVIMDKSTNNSNNDSTYTKFEDYYLLTDYSQITKLSTGYNKDYFVVPEISKKIDGNSGHQVNQVFDFAKESNFASSSIRFTDRNVMSRIQFLDNDSIDRSVDPNKVVKSSKFTDFELNAGYTTLSNNVGRRQPYKAGLTELGFDLNDWDIHDDYWVSDSVPNLYVRMNAHYGKIRNPWAKKINGRRFPELFIPKNNANITTLIPDDIIESLEKVTAYLDSNNLTPTGKVTGYVVPRYDSKENSITGFHAKLTGVNSAYVKNSQLQIDLSSLYETGETQYYYKILTNSTALNTYLADYVGRVNLFNDLTAANYIIDGNKLSIDLALSSTDLSNAENYGIIIFPRPSMLQSNHIDDILSTSINNNLFSTTNLSDNYANLPNYLNADTSLYAINLASREPGKAYRSYSFEYDASFGVHNLLINNRTDYLNGLAQKVIDSKGNITNFEENSSVNVKRFTDDVLAQILPVEVKKTSFANAKMVKTLPTGESVSFTVKFDPITGQPKAVYNQYGISVNYNYDKLERIKSIASSKLYEPGGF